MPSAGRDSLFSVIRAALQDGAGAGDARYIYPEAWEATDKLEALLDGAAVTFTDPRVGYAEIQVDRLSWEAISE